MEEAARALIVDDEEEEALLIREMLEMDGYETVVATSGEEALDIFERERFDIVLSDLRMPSIDGIKLLRQINTKDPYVASIVFTGDGSQEQVIKAFREGRVNYFLLKPFHADQLFAAAALSIREQQVRRREDGFYRELEQRVKEVTVQLEEKNRILEELSITDNVTGLFNHRHFFTVLETEIDRSRRQNHPLSLVLFDTDGFKSFNDRYGHLAGDRILQRIGSLITEKIRNNVDKGFRYGGDEFTIILPEAGLKQAESIVRRILDTLRDEGEATLSIGLVEFKPEYDVRLMVSLADEAMYQSKNSGGDQITAHGA
ncbi:MAG: diguanylate cyclase [Nitrospinota bacterium]|jgi:diguanylate cyclase (GGDEF)-like protein|nr:diguanylate cyclase [Nitrospinota bacterium]